MFHIFYREAITEIASSLNHFTDSKLGPAPLRNPNVRAPKQPNPKRATWFNAALSKQRRETKALAHKARNGNDAIQKRLATAAKNRYYENCRKARNVWHETIANDIQHTITCEKHNLWAKIDKMINYSKPTELPIETKRLREYYKTVFDHLDRTRSHNRRPYHSPPTTTSPTMTTLNISRGQT